ncbi:uncharacterized protein [Nicotiana tomentosiformis]|uniref:uncharacterized protein n=1 Tax=Nicotiana tomentosiformis TaxID=4098 RepID=UPI00388C441B
MVLTQRGGQGSNKRPRHSGGFSSASSGGKGTFGRGHPPRPFHLALQASYYASSGRGPHMPYFDELVYSAPPAPISAALLQSFQGGYSGRHGQFQGQQSQQPTSCYTCGDPRHIARFCPRPSSSSQPEAESSDDVITDTVSICNRDASTLFDQGSTYSYVSSYFASYLVMPLDSLSAPIFDVILGMDWLSPYHAILDYHAKTVTLALLGLLLLEWRGAPGHSTIWVISYMKARRMVEKGCLAYLAYVRDSSVEVPTMDSIPVVREFPDSRGARAISSDCTSDSKRQPIIC